MVWRAWRRLRIPVLRTWVPRWSRPRNRVTVLFRDNRLFGRRVMIPLFSPSKIRWWRLKLKWSLRTRGRVAGLMKPFRFRWWQIKFRFRRVTFRCGLNRLVVTRNDGSGRPVRG